MTVTGAVAEAVHTIWSMANVDSRPAGVDTATTSWPAGLAVTENGAASGGTSLVSPSARSLAVGPAASSASVSAGDSGDPGRGAALGRPFFTKYTMMV